MLFNIYISELIDRLTETSHLTPVYADDIACITTNESKIGEMIETIHNWSIKYKISLNPRKSAIVKFTNRSKLDKQIYKHQFIDSQGENQQYCINYQNKYKYMGIEIDRNLNLKDQRSLRRF